MLKGTSLIVPTLVTMVQRRKVIITINNNEHLHGIYYVLGIIGSILQTLIQFVLTITLRCRHYYYPHFIGGETMAHKI